MAKGENEDFFKWLELEGGTRIAGSDAIEDTDEQDDGLTDEGRARMALETRRARQLLGLDRVYQLFDGNEKQQYLHSQQRIKAFDSMDTSTHPSGPAIKKKQGIASEVLREGYISEDVMKWYPVVYLGSGDDIEYPLALGSRHIIMVDSLWDPSVSEDGLREGIKTRIEKLIGKSPEVSSKNMFAFAFDFGSGPEPVRIELKIAAYIQKSKLKGKEHTSLKVPVYELPGKTGLILVFAPYGAEGSVEYDESMGSHLVEGGVLLGDNLLIRTNPHTFQRERIELGHEEEE